MNKYNNIRCEYNGIKFDSLKEMARYHELLFLVKSGEISDLKLQEKFELLPKSESERAVAYTVDFYYFDNKIQKYVAEDVKSCATKKDKSYIIKRKLFKAKYADIIFKEVF